MGGAIIARRELIAEMRKDIVSMGPTLDRTRPSSYSAAMRTYFLRYERQCANALSVSLFLKSHPRVKQVFYPGLEDHPQHALARRQMRDFGSVVTLELDGGYEEGGRFANRCSSFRFPRAWDPRNPWCFPPNCWPAMNLRRNSARLPGSPGDGAALHWTRGRQDLLQDLGQALDRAFT